MHNDPHSFDTRGLLWSLGILAGIVGVTFGGAKYGTAIAANYFYPESQVAAVPAALDVPLAPEREEYIPELEVNVPSRFTVDAPIPQIPARSFIIADLDSDVVFAQKSSTTIYPIASISKLLTALVAEEQLSASTTVTVNDEDIRLTFGTPGSVPRGESFVLGNSFYPLLTESNNTIANTLARTASTSAFMDAMRRKAASIGMTLTSLEDPSGISAKNAASALDIYLLTRHIYAHSPHLLDLTRAKNTSVKSVDGTSYTFNNYNVFSGDARFIGGKTGYTDQARQTMTTVFKVPVGTTTATLGIVVLGSDDRKRDTEALLRWFTSFAKFASSTAD